MARKRTRSAPSSRALPPEVARARPIHLAIVLLTACAGSPGPSAHTQWGSVAGEVVSAPVAEEGEACRVAVSDLPASDLYDPSDRRLQGPHVLVAHKSARRLMLYADGELTACWRAALGFTPQGPKQAEGDGKTPEGWYRTSDKPWSAFDDAIAVHYPNVADAEAAEADGRIRRRTAAAIVDAHRHGRVPPQRTALGGAILIHGGGSSVDWTLGCIALDDFDLADLRGRLPSGKRTDLLVLP
jgi:hypothetical protein